MLEIKRTITEEYLGGLQITPITEIETMVERLFLPENEIHHYVKYVELKTEEGNIKIRPEDFTAVLFAISKALHFKITQSHGLSSEILAPVSTFQSSSEGAEAE